MKHALLLLALFLGALSQSIIDDCTFDESEAVTGGGAVFFSNPGATLTITNSEFTLNTATNGSGGALYLGGAASLSGLYFSNNTAALYGGAAYTSVYVNQTTSNWSGITSENNQAVSGGAFYLANGGALGSNIFTGNT